MDKFKVLALPIAVVIWIGMNLLFIEYGRDVYQDLQERRLDMVVNYAVDAAVDEIVDNSTDLGLDYADIERVIVEPAVALDTFCTLFLKSYGMSLSKENYSLVKTEYLPVFAVCAYDGYYIGQPTRINNGGAMDLIFSVKQPYTYKNGNKLYALNLGLKDAKLFNEHSISKVNAPISEIEQKIIINNNVSDALMQTVYKQKEGSMFSTIYIPTGMSDITRTNPIDRVTVFAYLTNVDVGYGNAIETFGIGGSRITKAENVGCYIKDGMKMYTFVENIPPEIDVIEVFESPIQAAERGYYVDPEFMTH